MRRFLCLVLLSVNVCLAQPAVSIDVAAEVYEAAGIRAQIRASLVSMPKKMRQMFANDPSAKLGPEQLDAVEHAAARGFRIDVFEAPALTALAAGLDAATVKKALAYFNSPTGRRMVEADIALAGLDEATLDKVTTGELAAASTPERDALFGRIEAAEHSTESAVDIYLGIARSLAIGTAIGAGLDPTAAAERARKNADEAARAELGNRMHDALLRYLAYGYRDLSTADLHGILDFLQSRAGVRYVGAYLAGMNAGFDAMGQRCGERIGESWHDLAVAARATTTRGASLPTPPPSLTP